ncbi:hypothetical protein GCM10010309_01910 [Streptomyces violaceochromogenes]|nr:hypothetical protein GCM10010309_01910 [Streptomyces violaceochromogenes]
MSLELRHAIDMIASRFMNRLTLHDVAHQRRPDDARVRQGRLEDRGADDPGETIHGRDCLFPTSTPTIQRAGSHMINSFC